MTVEAAAVVVAEMTTVVAADAEKAEAAAVETVGNQKRRN
jgi:hypothetical protein